jgi:nitronate monooxygenase
MTTRPSPFRTPATDLLGISVPILQSGMGRVAGPELAAAVCNAGGLGILAGLRLEGEELRAQIRRLRTLTDRPFGVNLWLHPDVESPVDTGAIADETFGAVQGALNQFRERLGLPLRGERPASLPALVGEAFEVILEERVPVWSVALGDPGTARVGRCHEHGIKVVAMTATVAGGRALAASGVDLIVAQGWEAGGHRSTWPRSDGPESDGLGTLALVPRMVDEVPVPVIAAGGIADGRGLVAALALGASGAMLGTRFVATRESLAPEFWKRTLIARPSARTTVTTAFTGLPARVICNTFVDEYVAGGAPTLPALVQYEAARDIVEDAAQRGDGEYVPQYAGESLGLIHDLPSSADVVRRIVEEANAARARLAAGEARDSA